MAGELEKVDPESETEFEPLTSAIAWKISARLAVGDQVDTPAGIRGLAELVADLVIDRFVVRARTDETPRYRWGK